MNEVKVGASILNIITESLYDKPLVVFREYVQNSVDSISYSGVNNTNSFFSSVWVDNNNLYFLDNGNGISESEFTTKMQSIAFSGKVKETDIGYKGIGRLSGISYCKKLHFINIIDIDNNLYQEYTIDCVEYNRLQKTEEYNKLSFVELMKKIGTTNVDISSGIIKEIISGRLPEKESMNHGFLVILEDISIVLKNVIKDTEFRKDLCWLLPVPFKDELLNSGEDTDELFKSLSESPALDDVDLIAAKSFNIYFNGVKLYRPLDKKMFRTYLCKCDFEKYAVCIQSFSNEKIEIDRKNPFTGIRIYIDNMLLCDESELIPALVQYGYTTHSAYELIQSVRGMGVMIYIVDKINISANARRTFIELTDTDSLEFLKLVAQLVENIYTTRYALSKYASAIKKESVNEDTIEELQQRALHHLETLAKDQVVVETIGHNKPTEFVSLSIIEQKKVIKSKLTKEINEYIKTYLNQTDSFDLDNYFEDFKTWLFANK